LAVFEPKCSRTTMEAIMYELVEAHERKTDRAKPDTRRTRRRPRVPHEGSWAAIWIALVLGLLALGVLGADHANRENGPGDEALSSNFFAHEATFDELAQMLSADRRSLAAKGTTAIDLTTIARLDTDAARLETYGHLLQQISVASFRYYPASGRLILVPDGEENAERPSESYVYLPDGRPQSFVQHHGYYLHGPGVDILSGDRPLKSPWFIRHEIAIQVAVSPY
jgi:hypothetical protein